MVEENMIQVVGRGDRVTAWSEDELARLTLLEAGRTICVSMRKGVHPRLISWATGRGMFVRIDRQSPWGNPFVLGRDGDRDTVIRRYAEEHLPYQPSLLAALGDLRGKALGCWCAPARCHGDVLADAVRAR